MHHILLCCPGFEELRESVGEVRRETNLKTILGSAELAKRAAQFLIKTRLLTQFSHANLSLAEEDISEVDTRGKTLGNMMGWGLDSRPVEGMQLPRPK